MGDAKRHSIGEALPQRKRSNNVDRPTEPKKYNKTQLKNMNMLRVKRCMKGIAFIYLTELGRVSPDILGEYLIGGEPGYKKCITFLQKLKKEHPKVYTQLGKNLQHRCSLSW